MNTEDTSNCVYMSKYPFPVEDWGKMVILPDGNCWSTSCSLCGEPEPEENMLSIRTNDNKIHCACENCADKLNIFQPTQTIDNTLEELRERVKNV